MEIHSLGGIDIAPLLFGSVNPDLSSKDAVYAFLQKQDLVETKAILIDNSKPIEEMLILTREKFHGVSKNRYAILMKLFLNQFSNDELEIDSNCILSLSEDVFIFFKFRDYNNKYDVALCYDDKNRKYDDLISKIKQAVT